MRPNLHLITITAHFRISIFFSLSHNCIYSSFKSKQTTNVYYFCLLTISFSLKHFLGLKTMSVIYGFIERDNRSLDGTPLGQPSGRDAPSISILQSNTVSSKNEIYSKLLKILYSFSCNIKYSQINSKII